MKVTVQNVLASLVAVALLVLLLLLLPGVLVGHGNEVDVVEETLERKLAELDRIAENGVCEAIGDARIALIDEETIARRDRDGGPPPVNVLPTDPEQTPLLPEVSVTRGRYENLAQLIDDNVALIVSRDQSGNVASVGTGFFIDDRHMVTNHHVVENAVSVSAVNETLGVLSEVEVLVTSDSSPDNGLALDLALLRFPESVDATGLPLVSYPEEMQQVFAAGYPGVVTDTDINFQRALRGESASPDTVKTPGMVSAIQNRETEYSLIIHSAEISPGSSGGPLVDECGRVVGINTWGRSDEALAAGRTVYLAQPSARLQQFLDAAGFPVYESIEGVCGLAVAEAGSEESADDGESAAERDRIDGAASDDAVPASDAPDDVAGEE